MTWMWVNPALDKRLDGISERLDRIERFCSTCQFGKHVVRGQARRRRILCERHADGTTHTPHDSCQWWEYTQKDCTCDSPKTASEKS